MMNPRLTIAVVPAAAFVALLGGCAGNHSGPATPDTIATDVSGHDMPAVRDAWRSLGLYNSECFRAAGTSDNYRSGPFSARVFHLEVDGRNDGGNGTDAVVRIGDPAEWDWQYLVFASRSSGWKFLGNIDLPNNRLEDPKPESVVIGPGRAWLVVHSLRPSNNGLSAEYDTRWFQVMGDRLVEVLKMPGHGRRYDSSLPFSVTYRAEVIDTFLTPENQAAVTYRVEATYFGSGTPAWGREPLFRREGIARYVQAANSRFILDSSQSTWTEGQLTGLAKDGTDEFLHHNARQVSELARSEDADKRLWVGALLSQCQDSPEKEQISSEMSEIRE
jgi:hypothetical protein